MSGRDGHLNEERREKPSPVGEPAKVGTGRKAKRPKPKPAGLWGTRVDALIRALGWPQSEWCRHFGFSARAVRRVRYGGRPRLAFVLRVRKLEVAYAAELEALAQGLIATRGRLRYCWIELPRPPARPPDLQHLGTDEKAEETDDW